MLFCLYNSVMSNFVFDVLNFYNREKPDNARLRDFILGLNYRQNIKKSNGVGSSILNETKKNIRYLAKKGEMVKLRKIINNIICLYDYDFDMDREQKIAAQRIRELNCMLDACSDSLEWGSMPRFNDELEKVLKSIQDKEYIQKYMLDQ